MSDVTARFSLPLLIPGQAQKELHHNEALTLIDAALHAAVEGPPLALPPADPSEGQCWVIASEATETWAGRADDIAIWTDGGWRFLRPDAGMLVWNKSGGHWMHFDGIKWVGGSLPVPSIWVAGQQVVGPRQPPVSSPSGGTIIDQEARAAIDQITAALMSHGLIG